MSEMYECNYKSEEIMRTVELNSKMAQKWWPMGPNIFLEMSTISKTQCRLGSSKME